MLSDTRAVGGSRPAGAPSGGFLDSGMRGGAPGAARPWKVRASAAAMRTSNPIRQVVDRMDMRQHGPQDSEKTVIPLSIGDPTVFGNLSTHEIAAEAVAAVAKSGKANGYPPAVGFEEARQAVAQAHSDPAHGVNLRAADVILANGCSHALQMCIGALADPGANVLIPQPGFALYSTLLESAGIAVRKYPLVPARNWEIDLDKLDKLVDHRTAAIIINNPSNPCGAVFSRSHIRQILSLCDKRRLPIIADEVYAGQVYGGAEWLSMASVNAGIGVPILSVGGLSKRYLVPGWRLGWIVIHESNNALTEIREGLHRLASLIMGPNSLIQVALPTILRKVPVDFHRSVVAILAANADVAHSGLLECPGIRPFRPQGAMYIMTEILVGQFKGIVNDQDFVQKLFAEEAVIVLPGSCFSAPNYFRVNICAPQPDLKEACKRIRKFCLRRSTLIDL